MSRDGYLPDGVAEKDLPDNGEHCSDCPCDPDHPDFDKCSCGVVECDCAFKGPKCICDDQDGKADRWDE
jgi:hypothetical protein